MLGGEDLDKVSSCEGNAAADDTSKTEGSLMVTLRNDGAKVLLIWVK